MDSPPFTADVRQVFGHYGLDSPRLLFRETVVFPELRRSVGTIQVEHGLASIPDAMNVRRTMIVRIDDDPQTIDAQYRRHDIL
jgi:hypothetical protein